MSLLRVDASIRREGSVSREVLDSLERAWTERHPGAVVRRDLGLDPLPVSAWLAAVSSRGVPEGERTPEHHAALALAGGLADELLAAAAVVIGVPLYNFGLPAPVKTWVDLLITDPRFAPGTTPLAGRPVGLVFSRGGGYGPGTPREGWDHAAPYLVQVFGSVFGADVTVVEAELTLAEVNPAMADLVPAARQLRARAHDAAADLGKGFAERLAAPAA